MSREHSATITWSEARRLAHETGRARSGGVELVPIADATGRTLAREITALAPLPGYASSAMDGWVVAGDSPWQLGAPIHAGDRPSAAPLAAGTARAITTGGPVPDGSRGVLRSEHGTTRDGMLLLVASARPDEPGAGEHVRHIGEEIAEGEPLVSSGVILTPPRIALAAVAGYDSLPVREAPTADVVLLGSEVIGSGIAAPGLVRDAYSPHFPALLTGVGVRVRELRHLSDDLAATTDALGVSSAAFVLSTGGTAGSAADHVRGALRALGATLVIDGVAMRPGHPVMLALLPGDRPMLCLPGNPLAAMLTLASIGMPLVDGLLGRPLAALGTVTLAGDVHNEGGQTRLVTFTLRADGAVPTSRQGSGLLRGLAASDGVAVIPPGGASAGSRVETVPLPW